MRCSHCGVCCEKTEMLVSNADIKRLERLGHDCQKFVRYDRHGFAKLRNRHGVCVFYDAEKCRCQIYRHRPLGCRIYPVIYSEDEGIVVDDLCPAQNTVSETELRREGKKLVELLQRIDNEAHTRLSSSCARRTLQASKEGNVCHP
jgi:Fe-S-cluster containining protein